MIQKKTKQQEEYIKSLFEIRIKPLMSFKFSQAQNIFFSKWKSGGMIYNKPGKHKGYIYTFDYTSLYIYIIQNFKLPWGTPYELTGEQFNQNKAKFEEFSEEWAYFIIDLQDNTRIALNFNDIGKLDSTDYIYIFHTSNWLKSIAEELFEKKRDLEKDSEDYKRAKTLILAMVGYFGKNTNDVFTPLFCYVVAVGRALINQKAEELQKLGGTLLYINTDGVILNFKEPLIYNQKNSKILGDFGIEESGDECWIRCMNNYIVKKEGEIIKFISCVDKKDTVQRDKIKAMTYAEYNKYIETMRDNTTKFNFKTSVIETTENSNLLLIKSNGIKRRIKNVEKTIIK